MRIQVSTNPAAILLLPNCARLLFPGTTLMRQTQSSALCSTCLCSSRCPWGEQVWGWEKRENLLLVETLGGKAEFWLKIWVTWRAPGAAEAASGSHQHFALRVDCSCRVLRCKGQGCRLDVAWLEPKGSLLVTTQLTPAASPAQEPPASPVGCPPQHLHCGRRQPSPRLP